MSENHDEAVRLAHYAGQADDIEAALAAAEERGRRSVFADPEALARRFHETYERLAPEHGYETRRDSAVPWEKVPEKNRRLMIAVCTALAPRDSAPVCDNCKRAAKVKDGRTDRGIEIGPCYCDTLRAPRDSGKEG